MATLNCWLLIITAERDGSIEFATVITRTVLSWQLINDATYFVQTLVNPSRMLACEFHLFHGVPYNVVGTDLWEPARLNSQGSAP